MAALQPKFKIGEKVWIMSNNKPAEIEITAISCLLGTIFNGTGIKKQSGDNGTTYMFGYYTKQTTLIEFADSELFPTREALIESLK